MPVGGGGESLLWQLTQEFKLITMHLHNLSKLFNKEQKLKAMFKST